VLIECPAAPAVGVGRRDLKASADVVRREKIRCSHRPRRFRGATSSSADIYSNRAHLAARDTSSKFGERRRDRITRLRGILHRRHSHVPVRAVVGRVFSTRQWGNPLLDARRSLAIAPHTKARDPRASSWCTGVKPATGRLEGAGAEVIIAVQPQTRQRGGRNIRGYRKLTLRPVPSPCPVYAQTCGILR
jgi:hypothetical protein